MCGIFAILSIDTNIKSKLISGLNSLEYRGYDSSGIAFINDHLQRIRAVGRIKQLEAKLVDKSVTSHVGIAHTRWATNGKVTEANAHPHVYQSTAIVHNGIIENYLELKQSLIDQGNVFETDTDSEVIAHIVGQRMRDGESLESAVTNSVRDFRGNFAFLAIDEHFPNDIVGVVNGAPLVLGISDDALYLSSDAISIAPFADNFIYLKDNDIIKLSLQEHLEYSIINMRTKIVSRPKVPNHFSSDGINKNQFKSYMLKEIYEEPKIVFNAFNSVKQAHVDISSYQSIHIIACGTSFYAGLLAKYWFESNLRIHTSVELASEFRYRNPVLFQSTLYVLVSQSGETSDTLCALKDLKAAGMHTLAIVNVCNSSIAREAEHCIYTESGPEIGVASTKNFVSQLIVFWTLCDPSFDVNKLQMIQNEMQAVLRQKDDIEACAKKLLTAKSLFYIGRGSSYPIAQEGALKIKELSYIHTEGIAAGELKHGPIAVIDESVYTVALAPFDKYFYKIMSNIEQILTRNGNVLVISDDRAHDVCANIRRDHKNLNLLLLNGIEKFNVFGLTTCVHILAYFVAQMKGLDVDKPRNLAKSVTVE